MNNMYTIIFTSSQHILKYFLYCTIHKIQNVTNQMKINKKIPILIKLDRNFKIHEIQYLHQIKNKQNKNFTYL